MRALAVALLLTACGGTTAPEPAPPNEQQSCDLLARYYSALEDKQCADVFIITSGDTCAESLVRLEGCLNDAACHRMMVVGCPMGLPELR